MKNKIIVVNVTKVKNDKDEEETFVVRYQNKKFNLVSRTNCFFTWRDCKKILKEQFIESSFFDCFDYNRYHVDITTMDEV